MQQESGISDLHLKIFVLLYPSNEAPFYHLMFLCFLAITSYLSVCVYLFLLCLSDFVQPKLSHSLS